MTTQPNEPEPLKYTVDGWPPNLTEAWSPAQHPHIQLRYEPRKRDPASGMPEDQSFEVRCLHVSESGEVCGGRWRGACTSGRIREKALMFAASHGHRDPFAASGTP